MTRRALCALVVALLLASLPACGKYGPPKRRLLETPANAAQSPDTGASPAGGSCEEEPEPQARPAPPETSP